MTSYGQKSCYPLAFGLPALLMIVATAIFVLGYKLYTKKPTEGNLISKLTRAVGLASKRKICQKKTYAHVSWLSAAEPEFSPAFIKEIRRLLSVLVVFIPVCLFWALFDQQGSRWTFQALQMNPKIKLFGQSLNIKAEQMQTINAVLILVLIPVFDKLIYPGLGFLGFTLKPLVRMFWGLVLGVISFIMAAILQFTITKRGTFIPNPDDPMTEMCVDGCIHILAQAPQYIILTSAEIMVSITGLEFAYSQAPAAMKSVCQSAWLLTIAVGNLVVIFFNEVDFVRMITKRNVNAWNFVMWSGIMTLGCLIFILLAWRYEYFEESKEGNEPRISPKSKEANDLCEATSDQIPLIENKID
jgi:dipeptide/tripeptide permease